MSDYLFSMVRGKLLENSPHRTDVWNDDLLNYKLNADVDKYAISYNRLVPYLINLEMYEQRWVQYPLDPKEVEYAKEEFCKRVKWTLYKDVIPLVHRLDQNIFDRDIQSVYSTLNEIKEVLGMK